MAMSGIKKYDSLPSRVGIFDVDYMRYVLSREKINPKNQHSKKMEEVKMMLDAAYKLHKMRVKNAKN